MDEEECDEDELDELALWLSFWFDDDLPVNLSRREDILVVREKSKKE